MIYRATCPPIERGTHAPSKASVRRIGGGEREAA